MSSGHPLTDEDRLPWLESLRELITQLLHESGGVLASSALKESYRSILQPSGHKLKFVYLKADRKLIRKRLAERKGHFMPDALIDSQFEALEEPLNSTTIDASLTPKEILKLLSRQN